MLDEDEFRKASKAFMRTAARISAPLWWVSPDANGGGVRHNGTAFFLRTETSLFGVTAAHVVEGEWSWRWHREHCGCSPLRLSGWNDITLEINWDARLISVHPAIDVATFSITEVEIGRLGQFIFTNMPEPWPAKIGEWLSYCGFPGAAARRSARGETTFGANTKSEVSLGFALKLSIVSARTFLQSSDIFELNSSPKLDFQLPRNSSINGST